MDKQSNPENNSGTAAPTCAESGCAIAADLCRTFNFQPYCGQHYFAAMNREFRGEFNKWQSGENPSARFKSLLARLVEEEGWLIEGDSYLSKARIRDRGFDFTKSRNRCVFKITRHPGAFQKGYVEKRIVQTWQADFSTKTIHLLDSRDWKSGDPDGRHPDRLRTRISTITAMHPAPPSMSGSAL
jgi:hypothetical protein